MNLILVRVAILHEFFPHVLLYVVPCARVLVTPLKYILPVQGGLELLPADADLHHYLFPPFLVLDIPILLQDI